MNEGIPIWASIVGTILFVLVFPLLAYIFTSKFRSHNERIIKAHNLANEAKDMGIRHEEQIKTLFIVAEKQATKDQVVALSVLLDEKLSNTNKLLETYNRTVEGARNELVSKHLIREEKATRLNEKLVDQNNQLINDNNLLRKDDD